MAIFEFQVTAAAFLGSQLANLRGKSPCSPPPFTVDGFQIVVDHFEFGNNAFRHDVQVTVFTFFEDPVFGTQSVTLNNVLQTQLAQDIVIVVAGMNDVLSQPNQTPVNLISVPATVVMNLSYFSSGGQCYFAFALDHVEVGPLPSLPEGVDPQKVSAQIQSLAASLVPGGSIPFDVAGLVVGAGVNVENAGLSVDTSLTCLAFRAETGPSSLVAAQAWASFYNGNVPDNLAGADWAFFIQKGTLEALISTQVGVGLFDSTQFQLKTGVSSTYSNPGGKAHITTTFTGSVDATICTADVDVTLDSNMTLGAKNSLSIDMNLSHNVHNSACAITAGLLGAALGGVTDLLMVPIVNGVLNPLTGFMGGVATVLYISATKNPPTLPLQKCTALSDTHYVCTRALPLTQPLSGQLALSALVARDDGILLTGSMQSATLTTAIIQISFNSFGWQAPVVPCGELSTDLIAAFRAHPKTFVVLSAEIFLSDTGSAPLTLCGFSVLNDALGVFPASNIHVAAQQSPIDISIVVPYPGDAYFAAPYPCELLITTNGGTRLVSIPPPAQLAQSDIDAIASRLGLEVGECAKLMNPFFGTLDAVNPEWLGDPPPNELVDHLWEIEIIGLPARQTATLLDASKQTLVTAIASSGVSTHLAAAVQPAANEVGLQRGPAATGTLSVGLNAGAVPVPLPAVSSGIAIDHQLMLRKGTIFLPAPCLRIGAVYVSGRPAITVVLSNAIEIFDLTLPSQPEMLASWQVTGLQGAIPWRDVLLGFGDDGFAYITTKDVSPHQDCCTGFQPVIDAAAGASALYAITNTGLQIYSATLRPLSLLPIQGARRAVRIGQTLVVGGSNGVVVFDISDPPSPRQTASRAGLNVSDLLVPPDVGNRSIVAVLQNAPAVTLELISGQLNPTTLYVQPPWFADSARLPGLLARIGGDRTTIQVSAFGQSTQS